MNTEKRIVNPALRALSALLIIIPMLAFGSLGSLEASAPGDSMEASESFYHRYAPVDLPAIYARAASTGAPVYAVPFDAGQELPPISILPKGLVGVSLLSPKPVLAGDQAWYQTERKEYINARDLTLYPPSLLQGIVIHRQPGRASGWIVFGVKPSSMPGIAPDKETPALARYTVVEIRGEQSVGKWIWYQVGDDQWIEQRQIGLVKRSPVPAGIGPEEKWIDVNLYEQTLAAYEGDQMVFATLISSGLPAWQTPSGLFRIWAKVGLAKMSGREGYPDSYYLEKVPWTMYFNKDVALHGAYWHDRFGTRRSHGCVNLSPADAHWLFEWTAPKTGSNWTLSTPESPGDWVWVHS